MIAEPGGCLEISKPHILQRKVTGTVTQVNRRHHWFRVEYRMPCSDVIYHETFKTADPPGFLPWKHGTRSEKSKVFTEIIEK
jgi:hypothetical protein